MILNFSYRRETKIGKTTKPAISCAVCLLCNIYNYTPRNPLNPYACNRKKWTSCQANIFVGQLNKQNAYPFSSEALLQKGRVAAHGLHGFRVAGLQLGLL